MADQPKNVTVHARLMDAACDQPRRNIAELLREDAERQAGQLAELVGKAYLEGVRDGYVQAVAEASALSGEKE